MAVKVTVLLPSLRDRVALVPDATCEPFTDHEVEATLPSESLADPEIDTDSPATPSVSETDWSPPEIDTLGASLEATTAAATYPLA